MMVDQREGPAAAGDRGADMVLPRVDDCSYRLLTLPNGLKALLVHDPAADKGAAAADVSGVPGQGRAVLCGGGRLAWRVARRLRWEAAPQLLGRTWRVHMAGMSCKPQLLTHAAAPPASPAATPRSPPTPSRRPAPPPPLCRSASAPCQIQTTCPGWPTSPSTCYSTAARSIRRRMNTGKQSRVNVAGALGAQTRLRWLAPSARPLAACSLACLPTSLPAHQPAYHLRLPRSRLLPFFVQQVCFGAWRPHQRLHLKREYKREGPQRGAASVSPALRVPARCTAHRHAC